MNKRAINALYTVAYSEAITAKQRRSEAIAAYAAGQRHAPVLVRIAASHATNAALYLKRARSWSH